MFNPVPCVYLDCIIGGTVIDVHKLFLNVYRNMQSPLNVVVSCGLNNIPLLPSERTITQLKCFVYSIKSIHKDNKIVFATIPYAPKFCHSTLLEHVKMTARIKHINEWIEKFNASESGLSFDLSQFGIENSLDENGKIKHILEDWKEVSIKKKLHFSIKPKDKGAVHFTNLCNSFDRFNTKSYQDTLQHNEPKEQKKYILDSGIEQSKKQFEDVTNTSSVKQIEVSEITSETCDDENVVTLFVNQQTIYISQRIKSNQRLKALLKIMIKNSRCHPQKIL